MRILITTDVIHAGGAETFVLRLGQALLEQGHQVVVYPLYKNKVDYAIVSSLAPGIKVIPAKLSWLRTIQKADGLLRRLHIGFSALDYLFAQDMAVVIRKNRIQVVHSHLFTADKVAVAAAKKTGVPVVTTIHGDYPAYDHQSKWGRLKRIPRFQKKMTAVLSQMKSIVCICEEQIAFFRQRAFMFPGVLPLTKIYNGFTPPIAEKDKVGRAGFNIPQHAFVFCMVARGIPEKGWEEVLLAFRRLANPNCYLLLIGGSEYVESLKSAHASSNVLFLGKQHQPFRYLQVANAGLFCSKIKTEALPTVIIEYLAAGLPVISTRVGEAGLMLEGKDGPAGVTICSGTPGLVEALQEAMLHFVRDRHACHRMQQQTASAFAKFNMDKCVNGYMQIYTDSVATHSSDIQEFLP